MNASDLDECRGADGGMAPWARTLALWAIAGLGLMIGVLLYVSDRGASRPLLLPSLASLHGHPLFGAVGWCLPSFLHTLSFSLLSAAALPLRQSPPYGACAAWCAVNLAFELGQHPSARPGAISLLRLALGDTGLTRVLSSYFLRGTFDVGDVAAVMAGALAAAALLKLMQARGERHAT